MCLEGSANGQNASATRISAHSDQGVSISCIVDPNAIFGEMLLCYGKVSPIRGICVTLELNFNLKGDMFRTYKWSIEDVV